MVAFNRFLRTDDASIWYRLEKRNDKSMDEQEEQSLLRQIEELKTEHRDLDDVIEEVARSGTFNQLQIQRLKKRKLAIKDEINRLQSMLIPDIIA